MKDFLDTLMVIIVIVALVFLGFIFGVNFIGSGIKNGKYQIVTNQVVTLEYIAK